VNTARVKAATPAQWLRPSALAVAAVVALTGCGGSSPASSSQSAAGRTTFAQCLKQHGVNLPAGGGSGGGQPPGGAPPGGSGQPPAGGSGQPPAGGGAFSSAFRACSRYAPKGGFGGGGGAVPATFIKCMKSHGVTVNGGAAGLGQLNRSNSKVRKALSACQSLLRPGSSG
jgi:hypothetical protein